MYRNSSRVYAPYLAFTLTATLLLGPLELLAQSAAEVPESESPTLTDVDVFDSNRLLDVEIEISESDWDKLRGQGRNFASALLKERPPSPYTWFSANVTVNGDRFENVGLRKKGFIGSQDSERPSLKIKFDEFQKQVGISGIDRLTLNNNKQDRGLVSQSLTYELFREAGLPASRTSLARVSVNGTTLGIYTNVESIKRPMLKRNFGSSEGKLYEGTVADLFLDELDTLEAKHSAAEARDELRRVAELVDGEKAIAVDNLEKYLDVEGFLKFWAIESLIGFWDGYTNNQNNYFVYFNDLDGKLHFLPWGADSAWTYANPARMFLTAPASVNNKSVLANRLFHTDGIAERYRATMQSLLKNDWDEEALIAEVDRIEALVADDLHSSQEGSSEAMEESRQFIRSRRSRIERELKSWPPEIREQPRQPFYMAKIGQAKGEFTTRWLEREPENPYETGTAKLEFRINDEDVEFSQLGVYAMTGRERGMDGKRRPTVVFVGKRRSNNARIVLSSAADRAAFESPTGTPVPAQGSTFEGFWLMGTRMVGGKMTLHEAGLDPGDTIRGTLEVNIVQFRGNMR